MSDGALTGLFEPYADKISKGGDDLVDVDNEICYVMTHLQPYPAEKNRKEEENMKIPPGNRKYKCKCGKTINTSMMLSGVPHCKKGHWEFIQVNGSDK